MRRYFKAAMIVTAALLLLIVLAGLVYLNSGHPEELLRTQIIQQLETRFAVRVELDAVELQLLRTRVKIQGLKISDRDFPQTEPAIDLPGVEVDFSILSWLRPSASLDSLRLSSPVIRVVKDPNDRLNMINMFRREGEKPPDLGGLIRLAIKQWSLDSATLVYLDQPLILESGGERMEVSVRFDPAREIYRGRLLLGETTFNAGALQLQGVSLDTRFELHQNSIEFPSIGFTAPGIAGSVSGTLLDLTQLQYFFETDLTIEPALIKEPDLAEIVQSGTLRSRGVLEGVRGDFFYRTRLTSDRLSVADQSFTALEADLELDRDRTQARNVRARFSGGTVEATGSLFWDSERRSQWTARGQGVQLDQVIPPFSGPLKIRGESRFTGAFEWPGLEFPRIDGRGTVGWQGEWVLSEPGRARGPDRFPMSGTAGFRLSGKQIRLDEGVLESLSAQLNFSAQVNAFRDYRLQGQLRSEQGSELVRFGTHPVWIPDWINQQYRTDVAGTLDATIDLTADPEGWRIEGDATAQDAILNEQRIGDLSTHYRVENGEIQLSDLQLRDGSQLVQAELQLSPAASDPLQLLNLQASALPLPRWLPLAGFDLPVEGELSGSFRLSQEAGKISGEGSLQVDSVGYDVYRADRLNADIALAENEVRLSDLEGRVAGGRISGALSYDTATEQVAGRLEGTEISLEEVQRWSGRELPISGRINLDLSAQGRPDRLQLDLRTESREIRLGQDESIENVRLRVQRTDPDSSQALITLQAEHRGEALELAGRAGLETPYLVQLDGHFDQLPLAPYLAAYLPPTAFAVEGSASGMVHLEGPLANPADLQVKAAISALELVASEYRLSSQSPFEVTYGAQTLSIPPVQLVGNETQLTVSGTVDLGDDPSIIARTDGSINLLAFNPFLGGGSSSGTMGVEIVISGPLGDPRIVGKTTFQDGFLRHPSLPTTVFDADGTLRFTANQISIDELSASTSYGRVNLEGGIFLKGYTPERWRINLFGSGLRLEYPDEVFSTLDVDVDFLKSAESQLLSGVVYVRAADYREEISITDLILRYSGVSVLTPAASTGQETILDIEVEGYRTLRIDNNLAQVTASGDFKIRGTLDNPVLIGSINIDEGRLILEHNEYDITRGTVNFNDPRQTRPIINFEAETEVRDFSVNILMRGPVDQLKVSFRSDPPLPTPSIISLLAVGQTEEEILGTEPGQSQVGSLAIFGAGTLLSKSLEQKLQAQGSRLFGFDRVSIDPFLFGRERDPGARVTLGKQLNERLTVTYSTDLGNQTQGQIVIVEFKITDWLTAVGTGEQDGTIAIDFKLKKRF